MGRPSNDLTQAGVIVHIFDGLGVSGRPWEVSLTVDHMSASLIRKANPRLYWKGDDGTTAGLVLSPAWAKVLCSYSNDAGTQGKVNRGCGTLSCDRSKDILDINVPGSQDPCSWPRHALGDMIDIQPWYTYNEIILDSMAWQSQMPSLVEAFVFIAGDREAIGESAARQARQRFLQTFYPAPTDRQDSQHGRGMDGRHQEERVPPLLRFDPQARIAFQEVG